MKLCYFIYFSLPQAKAEGVLANLRRLQVLVLIDFLIYQIFFNFSFYLTPFQNGDHSSHQKKLLTLKSVEKLQTISIMDFFSNFKTLGNFRRFECSTEYFLESPDSYFSSVGNQCDKSLIHFFLFSLF